MITKKTIIKCLAKKISSLQKNADHYYYVRKDKNHSSWLLDQVGPLIEIAEELGIAKQVYKEAIKIYDFRNSGKQGYTLINGKIVKDDYMAKKDEDTNDGFGTGPGVLEII